MPEKTAEAKMRNADGTIRHRMGDVGYLDDQGRLWFCGRKAHRVITHDKTLFTIPCESVFNGHADVARTALVGLGEAPEQTPLIIVETLPGISKIDHPRIARELFERGARHELTDAISLLLFHDEFPTDVRHNAKIFREKLKTWAQSQWSVAYQK
jgi:acyl-coenzyme A synthetase/AMP-(fatty) acid ligase